MRVFPAFLFFAMGLAADCYAVREIPPLTNPVVDEAGIYSTAERQGLEDLIRSKTTLAQLQVWTVKSLDGEAIEALSIRAVEKWKLGTEKKDNGLLILIAKDDRRMRIEVGQGLEGSIPDVIAGRVVDQIMKPYFRNNQFFEGTHQAAMYLFQRLESPSESSDLAPSRGRRRSSNSIPVPVIFVIFVFFIIIKIMMFVERIKHPLRRRGPLGGFWGGGGSGGWGSGGGGWSGGGGGFSGGGSSGSW